MTGLQLKEIIFCYLKSQGWKHQVPTEYYGWDAPGELTDRSRTKHYCWHAALAVQIALDEGKSRESAKIPGGSVGPELVR